MPLEYWKAFLKCLPDLDVGGKGCEIIYQFDLCKSFFGLSQTEWHPYVLKEVLSKLTRDDAIEAIGEDLINYLHSELETYINV